MEPLGCPIAQDRRTIVKGNAMRNSRIEVRPISGAGGAEIFGVDVARELDDGTIGEIRDALNEHCVVFFRDQEIDVAQHKAFARRFGPIFIHPNYTTVSEDPEVVMVRREPGDASYVGEDWHTDTTMVRRAADGRDPLRHRRAAVRRRHHVRQPVPGLRGALADHEAAARGAARGAQRHRHGGPAGRQEQEALDQVSRR